METTLEQKLDEVIESGDAALIESYLDGLDAHEVARAVCDLTDSQQTEMLSALSPEAAAEVLDEIPEVEAVDAVANLSPETAAAIIDEMPSDEQADVVAALDDDDAQAVLAAMAPDKAELVRALAAYPADSAGGLMATELLMFRETQNVEGVLRRLRRGAATFKQLDVQYAYVTDARRRLTGVLRLRDLLLADDSELLSDLMIRDPLCVSAEVDLLELQAFFDDHKFLGVPVVDKQHRLLGIVSRSAVEEASQDQANSDFRRSLGVVSEEIRSMPTFRRSRLRLAWLSVNILLNVVAASVIATYEETLSQVIALAVFLPIISDMSGCSGNQAVAVSMRELSLGILKPSEVLRVWLKEASVGLLNGLALGGLLGAVGWWYTSNPWLGLVVGAALGLNTLVAVLLGGALPLLLKLKGVDPALASGPILTTVTDMFGFFLVLSLATAMLPYLVSG